MEELVVKAKKGDKEAFTQIVLILKEDLYKIAKTRITNEADIEDAIQETMIEAYKSIKKTNAKVIYMSQQGQVLNQKKVEGLSKEEHLIILCGHYEGIDQRILDKIVDEEISIGNYVLTGGELPAMVLIDSVSRYVDGVLSDGSTSEESFSQGILEYPQYTRPEIF